MRSWRLQLGGAVIGIAAAIFSAQSFASAREAVATYLIQPGDTLSLIATATGVSLDKLVNVNSIKNPDFIVAGQTLSLDGSAVSQPTSSDTASPSTAGGPSYTVKTGDTLWDISLTTGVSLDNIIKLNSLNNVDQLTVGQVLTLPAIAATRTVAAANQPAAKPSPTAAAKPKATPTAGASGQTAAQAKPSAQSLLQQKVAAEALRIGGPKV
ncbi:MAG TPA: LysM peptidoglycan-binding domain-containing protein, partial [Chloroflexota bacterium]